MDAIKSKITGNAYDKPAKTADGAFTTQDSDNAATLTGTSHDPNPETNAKNVGGGMGEKMEGMVGKAKDAAGDERVGNAMQKANEQRNKTGM